MPSSRNEALLEHAWPILLPPLLNFVHFFPLLAIKSPRGSQSFFFWLATSPGTGAAWTEAGLVSVPRHWHQTTDPDLKRLHNNLRSRPL